MEGVLAKGVRRAKVRDVVDLDEGVLLQRVGTPARERDVVASVGELARDAQDFLAVREAVPVGVAAMMRVGAGRLGAGQVETSARPVAGPRRSGP